MSDDTVSIPENDHAYIAIPPTVTCYFWNIEDGIVTTVSSLSDDDYAIVLYEDSKQDE